jgi:hypothetical protein
MNNSSPQNGKPQSLEEVALLRDNLDKEFEVFLASLSCRDLNRIASMKRKLEEFQSRLNALKKDHDNIVDNVRGEVAYGFKGSAEVGSFWSGFLGD